jgi:hypothetical protein
MTERRNVMSEKEKLENIENPELEVIDDDELDEVTGGGGDLNPPRVKIGDYNDGVKDKA